MISTTYDPDADALYVRIADPTEAVAESREIEPGVVLDLGAARNVLGIEVLGVRARSASTMAA